MEIKAKCKFDKDAVRAVTRLSTFKKANPKKTVVARISLCSVLILLTILAVIAFGVDLIPLSLIVINLFVIAMDCYVYFLLPKIQYKALANMKDGENEYLFCDDVLKVATKSEKYTGEANVEYSVFAKVYETSDFLFLYQTNNQAFPVDKSTIEGGTVEEIRSKLIAHINDKYILCNY